jgi:hypothetical protein
VSRTKEAKTGQKSRTPRIFLFREEMKIGDGKICKNYGNERNEFFLNNMISIIENCSLAQIFVSILQSIEFTNDMKSPGISFLAIIRCAGMEMGEW